MKKSVRRRDPLYTLILILGCLALIYLAVNFYGMISWK